jgi:hypothetical protein
MLILLGLGVRHTGLLRLLFALVWCVHWVAVGLANKLARKSVRRNQSFQLESFPCLECFLPNKSFCNLPYCRCEVENREERLNLELWRDQTPNRTNARPINLLSPLAWRTAPERSLKKLGLIRLSSSSLVRISKSPRSCMAICPRGPGGSGDHLATSWRL